MLKTVPGVIVDRVNVGGNESGQQSGFIGKGALATDTMWNLDGVVITDTTSGGASSIVLRLRRVRRGHVNTGGNDLKVQTGGIGINFVTRRGTNQFKGSARVHARQRRAWSRRTCPTRWSATRGCGAPTRRTTPTRSGTGASTSAARSSRTSCGSGARTASNDIKIVRLTQTSDKTFLKNTNAKINWDATSNDQVSVFYFNGAKEKFGRVAGQPPPTRTIRSSGTRATSIRKSGVLHPLHGLWKFEDNHVFGSNLFVNAKYALVRLGLRLRAARRRRHRTAASTSINDRRYGSWFDLHGAQAVAHHRRRAAALQVRRAAAATSSSSASATAGTRTIRRRAWSGVRSGRRHINGAGRQVSPRRTARASSTSSARTPTRSSATPSARAHDGQRRRPLGPAEGGQRRQQRARPTPMFPDLLPALDFDGSGPTIELERHLAARQRDLSRSTRSGRRSRARPTRATRAS